VLLLDCLLFTGYHFVEVPKQLSLTDIMKI